MTLRDPQAFGKELNKLMSSSRAYQLLDTYPEIAGSSWLSGGCPVLAVALIRLNSNFQLVGVEDQGIVQHVLVTDGKYFYDADGASTSLQLLRRWKRVELLKNPKIVPLKHVDLPGLECPLQAVQELQDLITSRLPMADLKTAVLKPEQIWKKLTPSMRVTFLEDALGFHEWEKQIPRTRWDELGLLPFKDSYHPASSSGSARHALGRRGLLIIGETVFAPTTGPGWHTPRRLSEEGQRVLDWVLGRAQNPTWLAVAGAALAGTALGSAATFRGVGGNPSREYSYVELEEYEGAILMFPAEGAQVLGWAVNQVTGKYGYSHCGLDVGIVNQDGTPLWIDSWAGEGVALRTPDRFDREPVRIPLSPTEASHARAVALHMLHEGTPYRGRTKGKHCSEFVVACLSRSFIEQHKIPMNATPNDLAVCFGLVNVKQLKKKLLR